MAHMNRSMWINLVSGQELRLVFRSVACVCACVCVRFIERVLFILLHRWDFILIDSYRDPFVKMTGRGEGDCRGTTADAPGEVRRWEVFHL